MRVDSEADSHRLNAALRDLVALSAIPATWIGSDPPAVATRLADALIELLQLDFAFVRLSDPGGVGAVEVTRGNAWKSFPEWLQGHLAATAPFPRKQIVPDAGGDSADLRGFAVPVGVNGEGGLVAAASERSDFPTSMEQLLLSLAANHAAAAFQSARLIHERKRAEEELRKARNELEVKVGERTAELHVANDELSALRRVATLVAQRVPPDEIFSAVSDEVGRLFASDVAAVVKFDHDDPAIVFVGVAKRVEGTFPIGTRWDVDEPAATAEVYRTGRSARLDPEDWASSDSPVAPTGQRLSIVSSVASPIIVEGRRWGAIAVASTRGQLPPETEDHLEKFTALVATAIANTESRAALKRLADEQAALRRVAVLVTRQPAPDKIFTAVTEEVGRLLGADLAAMHIFPGDGTATTIAGWTAAGPMVPIGSRLPLERDSVAARIFRTSEAARMDSYVDVDGETADVARGLSLRSTVGAPILVDGKLWGALMAATRGGEPLPTDAESRIAAFTELVATAVSNAQAREDLHRLAEEQAALRRVATLVAEGVPGDELFAAVTREVSLVLGIRMVTIDRYDGDGFSTVVGSLDDPGFPLGSRWPLEGASLGATVLETARPARVDDYADLESTSAAAMRSWSVTSAVGAPILVDGRPWGVICAGTTGHIPLPEGTEARLGDFTELLGAAIARAESREALARLAEEQAALRRVATLVARGAPPEEVFAAVSEEVGLVLGTMLAGMARYESNDTVSVVATWAGEGEHGGAHPLVPGPWPLEGDDLASTIARTHRPVRIDTYEGVPGPIAAFVRDELGVASSVGSPIVVEGRLWGALFIHTKQTHQPLPQDTESRLTGFTELVATAIANTQARAEVARLSEEQAALRRVATLVAKGAAPAEVFAKVAEETGNVLGNVDVCGLLRDEGDGSATVVAARGAAIRATFPVGARLPIEGDGVVASVLREGRPHRIDDYSALPGVIAEGARERGIGSAVGCPIVVRGGTWGALVVATFGERPCPPETERRITQFADLVATAIGNAEARAEVERLVDEQAALRRVATLVAEGVPPAEIFAAVSAEVAGLFGSGAAVLRFDDGGPAITFVGISGFDIPIGTHWEFAEGMASAEVYRTGRSARVDAMEWSPGSSPVASTARRLGIASTVASPIVVEGHLWGAISVSSARDELTLGIEGRLEKFAGHVATAIANADSRAELAASRRRIVAASDGARRRIERDLHDGTQQRLVSLGLAVRAVEANVPPDRSDLRSELSGIATGLADAVEELQELSRGIHPGILSQGGLAPALRTLARRSAVPVVLEAMTNARLPEPIEVAAYYVASEALANATKHAQASRIDISLAARNATLLLEIRDDGVGGADATRGSGLVGLTDRVEALGGSIRVQSRPGDGTHITAVLPLELEAGQESSATPKP